MNFAVYTLGCKVNQYETQALEQLLTQRGHTPVPFEGPADVYIINTCSVTAVSDKKSRQMIRRARSRAPEGILAVCGCYPQTHAGELEGLGIDLVAGTGDRAGFAALVERAWRERQPIVALDDALERREFEALPPGGLSGRTRAMLKIEDGCQNFCSYCIIPYARGRVRSLSPVDTALAVYRLVEEGYHEIVLTGIEISSWGQDLPGGERLIDLVEMVCEGLDPTVRLRLGSLEPRTITDDFCRRAAALPNLCPHFHLSLQSGCDGVLGRMNRRYDTARYRQSCQLLRQYFRDPAITTDLIVGFPGETEEEFQQTLDFIRDCAFSAMHIFPYSKRPGTPAAARKDQIPAAVKEDRARRAAQVAAELEKANLARQVGRTVDVLFEEARDGLWRGHDPRYCVVAAPCDRNLHAQVIPVLVEGVQGTALMGQALLD